MQCSGADKCNAMVQVNAMQMVQVSECNGAGKCVALVQVNAMLQVRLRGHKLVQKY